MDLSVLDRLKWMQQQQMVSSEFVQILGSDGRDQDLKSYESCYFGNNNDELQSFPHFPEFVPDYDTIDGCISRTNSFQMEQQPVKNNDENRAIAVHNKRKQEGKKEKNKQKKKIKTESSMKGKSNMSNNTETSSSGIEKPDYIHVRARRGEATDRHSLAERARREKISNKMKCLQDIVPGCNKVTGKAGMLDEIINYVQSLQQQVEFLSMKLSVLNPELEFHMDELRAKQVQAYFTDLPEAVSKQSMMADLRSFPLLQPQQGSIDYSVINSNQTTSLSTKDQTSSSWDTQSQCLYNSNIFSLK